VVFRPGPATDLDANQHHVAPTSPASCQPADDGPRAVAVWGPRAARSLAAPVRQAPAHAASSPALPGSSRHRAARGAAAGEHGAHRRHGAGLPPVQRSEPRPAPPADAQFPWFDVDHDTVTRRPHEDQSQHDHPSGQTPPASKDEAGVVH
jgi:hypothetical protein